MIKASRLNGKEFYINSDLIEFLEPTPDTLVSMTTGKKLVVAESCGEMVRRIMEFKQLAFAGPPPVKPFLAADELPEDYYVEVEKG